MNNYTLILFRDGRMILCSDERIIKGDYAYHEVTNNITHCIEKGSLRGWHKLIAGIPELPSISMSDEIRQELQERYGWADVEKLAKEDAPLSGKIYQTGYKDGFNKNQELRGFSLRDIEKAIQYGREVHYTNDEPFIQSLQQPIEVKVELEMEQESLGEVFNGRSSNTMWSDPKPKITHNSVTITKVL
jgi:hypothetical protein